MDAPGMDRVVRKPLDAEVLDQLLGEAPRTRGAA